MSYEVEKIELEDGVTVTLYQDDHSSHCNPRDNANLTAIVGSHRHYVIGDGEPEPAHMAALERGGLRLLHRYLTLCEDVIAFAPLGMIDHSGVSFYLGGGSHWSDSAGWDSGTVGYVYITRARLREVCGDDPTYLDPAWLAEAMAGEVKEYDSWARGDVYGYVVTDAAGEELDSCWGFIGWEYAEKEAREAGEYCRAEAREEAGDTDSPVAELYAREA